MRQYNRMQAQRAALDEMRYWVRIVAEHLKFHRGGLDPNLAQDDLFVELDTLARRIDALYAQILNPNLSPRSFNMLFRRTLALVTTARNLKVSLTNGIRNCQILSIIPVDLADHVRRETDRFLGVLGHLIGVPGPTRRTLGIPDGNTQVQAIPRLLIPVQPQDIKFTDVLEEIMFFSRIHAEHAGHISMTLRPDQEEIRTQALEFQRRFTENIDRARAVEESGEGFEEVLEVSMTISREFRAFVLGALENLLNCQLQTNFWPLLADHILREVDFFIGILELAQR
jgi:hypothetical protein